MGKWRIGYKQMDAAKSEARYFDQIFDSLEEADSFIEQMKQNVGLGWHYFVDSVPEPNFGPSPLEKVVPVVRTMDALTAAQKE